MSVPLRELNKENNSSDPHGPVKVTDTARLERLYAEQVSRSQEAQHEQERLEVEMLVKERQLLECKNSLMKANETNKHMAEKFRADVEFLEHELAHYKEREMVLLKQVEKQKAEMQVLKKSIAEKDDEMVSLNQELEEMLIELQNRSSSDKSIRVDQSSLCFEGDESLDLQTPSSRNHLGDSDDELYDTNDILLDNEELGELSEDEEDEDNVGMDSISLTTELSMKLEQKDTALKKLQFEIKSLKNEKTQLYNYVNKLLKNQPTPDQNDILKQKLVHRKILRAVSINAVRDTLHEKTSTSNPKVASNRYNSKRVMSNFVNLKSYKYDKTMAKRSYMMRNSFSTNSDDEDSGDDMDDELTLERFMLGYTVVGAFTPSKNQKRIISQTPLHLILKRAKQTEGDLDLNVD
ncbi:hypothetical protein BON22_3431 [Cyberlindnera fabianii]|uniref:Uncharacterized protein n=1 Tax=Cyberlindnera fabianii TaxID=36022 RepID=A0A1V2L4H1_CYBFA|nr:hypothetical protein BON22_3431 [Cyberlindnera fabianii]